MQHKFKSQNHQKLGIRVKRSPFTQHLPCCQRLSLLKVEPDSVLMAWSVMSPLSVLGSSSIRIHWCSKICSKVGRSEGLRQRHHLMSCWHPGEILLLKSSRPLRISSSCSKGISPHTMSYSRTPRDHTVAERPWYLWYRTHSGGL